MFVVVFIYKFACFLGRLSQVLESLEAVIDVFNVFMWVEGVQEQGKKCISQLGKVHASESILHIIDDKEGLEESA